MPALNFASDDWSDHERRRYACVVAIASQLVNITLNANDPGGKAELFGRVVGVCLAGIRHWEEQFSLIRYEPSVN